MYVFEKLVDAPLNFQPCWMKFTYIILWAYFGYFNDWIARRVILVALTVPFLALHYKNDQKSKAI